MEWDYVVIDVTITEQIHQMPRALTTPDSADLGHFLASDKLVLGEILNRSDKSGKQSLTTSPWVLGWDVPLPHQKCYRRVLTSPQALASDLPRLIDYFSSKFDATSTSTTMDPAHAGSC